MSFLSSLDENNFPNRLGDGANVYLASAELAAVCSILGKIPDLEEYMGYMNNLNTMADEVYRYMNFNEIADYMKGAENAKNIPLQNIQEVQTS